VGEVFWVITDLANQRRRPIKKGYRNSGSPIEK
jgi:hypothetical protein